MSRSRTFAEMAMERCDILGALSDEPEHLTRQIGGDAMRRAHEQVGAWMREAGMVVSRDNIGNLRGRYEGATPGGPSLLVGSHLDSVRDAGKYDGPLGVVVAIAAVQGLHDT
ncbi:MAG TPA: Zn-dependent hydrolase, partial [Candidatus Limnocylindria bacterium]|nr:Zn-dependent hydrolase [Candidatus Limnocylindria bacterium]